MLVSRRVSVAHWTHTTTGTVNSQRKIRWPVTWLLNNGNDHLSYFLYGEYASTGWESLSSFFLHAFIVLVFMPLLDSIFQCAVTVCKNCLPLSVNFFCFL